MERLAFNLKMRLKRVLLNRVRYGYRNERHRSYNLMLQPPVNDETVSQEHNASSLKGIINNQGVAMRIYSESRGGLNLAPIRKGHSRSQ